MTDADADEILEKFTEKERKILSNVSGYVRGINDAALDLRLKSGLIDMEQYNAINEKYDNYVPLRGWSGKTKMKGMFEGAKYGAGSKGVRSTGIKKAKGRKTLAESPVAYSVANLAQAIDAAEKNKPLQTLGRMVEQYPNKDIWEIVEPKVTKSIDEFSDEKRKISLPDGTDFTKANNGIMYYEKGKAKIILIHDKDLLRAVKGDQVKGLGAVQNVLSQYNAFRRAMLTNLNPEFGITNYIRDTWTAGITTSVEAGNKAALKTISKSIKGAKAFWNNEKGIKQNREWEKYSEEFKREGGMAGFSSLTQDVDKAREDVQNAVKDIMGDHTSFVKKGAKTIWSKAGLKKLFEVVDRANTSIENANRLSYYIELRKQGVAPDIAAYKAKELTLNFNRKGEWTPVINSIFLFSNAGIQGVSQLGRLSKKNPKAARKVISGLVGMGASVALLNHFLGGEDEAGEKVYNKMPSYKKAFNLTIPNGTGKPFTIPLPYGYNTPVALGQAVVNSILNPDKTAENLKSLAEQSVSSFVPLNPFKPTALGMDIIRDLQLNENFMGSRIYPSDSWNKGVPKSQQGTERTSELSKFVADGLNRLTGGNNDFSGSVDLYPQAIDHLLRQLGGSALKFYENSTETMSNTISGERTPLNKVPILRRFIHQDSDYFYKNIYYSAKNDMIPQILRAAKINKSWANNNPEYISMAKSFKRISQSVDRRRKLINRKGKGSAGYDELSKEYETDLLRSVVIINKMKKFKLKE